MCGHALSLELLASILRRNPGINLNSLFNNPTYAQLWSGKIATNLLDFIYTKQLNEIQRHLLLSFSVYREPVPLEAAQALLDEKDKTQAVDALGILLAQHILEI